MSALIFFFKNDAGHKADCRLENNNDVSSRYCGITRHDASIARWLDDPKTDSSQSRTITSCCMQLRSKCNSHWAERDLLINIISIIDIPIPTNSIDYR